MIAALPTGLTTGGENENGERKTASAVIVALVNTVRQTRDSSSSGENVDCLSAETRAGKRPGLRRRIRCLLECEIGLAVTQTRQRRQYYRNCGSMNAFFGQPTFGIQGSLAAHAGGGDGLLVDRVGDVAGGENAFHARRRAK